MKEGGRRIGGEEKIWTGRRNGREDTKTERLSVSERVSE